MDDTYRHSVYIVRCADDTLYTGYTVDIARRLEAHNSGEGAKYTRGRGPVTLVHVEEYSSRSQAMQREHEIKQLTRSQKQELFAQ